PLTSDVEGVARPMSHWVRRTQAASDLAADAAEAVRVARQAPGNIATLILPADAAWGELPADTPVPPVARLDAPPQTTQDAVRAAAQAIRAGQGAALMLGGMALREPALTVAGRIARATGVRLLSPTSNRRTERGVNRTPVTRVPYPVDQAVALLKDVRQLILVGASAPVAVFAYPGDARLLAPQDPPPPRPAATEQDLLQALGRFPRLLGIVAAAPALPPCAGPARMPGGRVLPAKAANEITVL